MKPPILGNRWLKKYMCARSSEHVYRVSNHSGSSPLELGCLSIAMSSSHKDLHCAQLDTWSTHVLSDLNLFACNQANANGSLEDTQLDVSSIYLLSTFRTLKPLKNEFGSCFMTGRTTLIDVSPTTLLSLKGSLGFNQ